LIIDDIPQVIYAPVKAFKKIIEDPKYLGAIIILLLFIAVQVGYEYTQFSKTYTENTLPTVDKLSDYTNATLWTNSSGIALSNNFNDFYNYSVYVAALGTTSANPQSLYSLFGNSSLEIDAVNTNSLSAALNNTFDVDCGASGFQNLSLTIKMVQPQTAPQSAALTLDSFNDSNSYTYDLTSSLSNTTAIGLWNNLTIPLGPVALGWTSIGAPSWSNVTALKLDFTYPNSSNITIRIGALFFRGQYQTPIQYNNTGILLQFLQVFSLQFILGWLLLAGLIYLMFKALKTTNVTWKPLFVALGYALFVMVMRALVSLFAALTLPSLDSPYDLSLGVRFDTYGALYYPSGVASALSAQSQAVYNSINVATEGFRFVTSAIFVVSYVWLGALTVIIIGTIKPEFSMVKRIAISVVGVGVTILLLLLLVGIV